MYPQLRPVKNENIKVSISMTYQRKSQNQILVAIHPKMGQTQLRLSQNQRGPVKYPRKSNEKKQ